MENFDFKSLLTKRNIIIGVAAICLVIALSLTIVFCTRDDTPEQPDSGEQTPGDGNGENNGIVNGGEIDLGNGDNNETPGDPETPDDPEPPAKLTWRDDPTLLTYEEYNNELTADERFEHYNMFATVDEYFDWYNAAKKAYDDANKPPEIDGDIDLGGGN